MTEWINVMPARKFLAEDIQYLEQHLAKNVRIIQPKAFMPEALCAAVRDIHVLLGEPPGKEVLDCAKSLRLIQIPWTGVDRLNFALLRQYSFPVCNSHSNANVVAEYAVALMLSISKQIPYHDRQLRQGEWCRPQEGKTDIFYPPESLHGKTAGILGFGTIGERIARLLSGFNMNILAVDTRKYDGPPQPLAKIVLPAEISEVVLASDFLFIALPLTERTRGLFNKNIFALMKPGAYLVNTSRGEIVNEEDLYDVLSNKRIAGAAIDTWYNYPSAANPQAYPSSKYPFHELDNLVLSPHRAGFGRGLLPHLDDAIDNINRLAAGQPLKNFVNLESGF